MKKVKAIGTILIGLMTVTIIGCGKGVTSDYKQADYEREVETNDGQVEIYSIDLCIAGENEEHVYNASYPRYKDHINATTHEVDRIFFEPKRPEVISREDFNVFYNLYEKHDKEDDYDKPQLYTLRIRYCDENEKDQSVYLFDHGDEFPEDLYPAIDKFNELCGEKVFSYPEKIVKYDHDFIYDNFGITAEDYSPEDIDGMLENYILGYFDNVVGSSTSDINQLMEGYHNDLENNTIEYLYAKELMNSNVVNKEQLHDFAEKFAKQLGDEWELDEYYDETIRVNKKGTDENFSITSGYYAKEHSNDNHGEVEVYFITGPEEMGYSTVFIYNKTGDYIIHEFRDCENFAEIVKAFAEME